MTIQYVHHLPRYFMLKVRLIYLLPEGIRYNITFTLWNRYSLSRLSTPLSQMRGRDINYYIFIYGVLVDVFLCLEFSWVFYWILLDLQMDPFRNYCVWRFFLKQCNTFRIIILLLSLIGLYRFMIKILQKIKLVTLHFYLLLLPLSIKFVIDGGFLEIIYKIFIDVGSLLLIIICSVGSILVIDLEHGGRFTILLRNRRLLVHLM